MTASTVQLTRATSRSRSRSRRGGRFRPIYLLVLAWLVGVLFPYIWMLVTSVTPRNQLNTSTSSVIPSRLTLQGYHDLLSQTPFLQYFANSVIVAAGTVICVTVLSLLAGTALSRFRFYGRSAVLYGMLFIQLLPVTLLIVPIYIEIRDLGLYNTKLGLIVVYTALALPFSTWLMKGFVDQIPKEIEEASFIDGCSWLQSLRHVILRLASPGIAAVATYSFISSWNEFLLALTLTNSPAARTIPTGLSLFIGENDIRWDYLTSAGVLAAVPILIGFMFAQKSMISGLSSGAIKG